jgi:hypothetical protein
MKPATDANPTDLEAGIGLRDYFAAHLAAAIIIAPKQVGVPRPTMEAIAAQAFEFADAMVRVRSR